MLQRRHLALLFSQLAWPLILLTLWLASALLVLPFISSLQSPSGSASHSGSDTFLSPAGGPPSWLAPILWLLWIGLGVLLALWAVYLALDWREDWIALTTRRLIIMDKLLFLRETRQEAPLVKVQNVTAEYPNAMSKAFDFGVLRVDTAGIGVLIFEGLSRPKLMREAIFAQQALIRAAQPPPEDHRKAAIRNLLGNKPDPLLHERPTPPTGYLSPEITTGVLAGTGPLQPGLNAKQNPTPVSGYGLFNVLFPFTPQRQGASVAWHKHWTYLLRGLTLPVLLYGAVIVAWVVAIWVGKPGSLSTAETLLGWAAVLLTPVCLGWVVWFWEDWRNDLYKLDRERVYHIESLPFGLREQSKETLITRITDVTYVIPGPLANLLNYGDVVLKTPGEATEFVFRGIPRPREVQQEIMARVDHYRLKDNADADREIEAWLKAYHEVQRESGLGV